MEKRELFLQMLKNANKSNINYIGTGNPLAQILIIAKEPSLDQNRIEDKVHIDLLSKNLKLWQRDKYKTLDEIPYRGEFSPMYPYKGQEFKKINDLKNNWGTSVTWMNYQKLHNHIFKSNGAIDFHENIFITDLNSSPSPKTQNANIDTVEARKQFISESNYFQSFPIVILDGVGYFNVSKEHNEIEHIFKVNFIKKIGEDSQPIWLHIGKQKPKLVINTYQMSRNVSHLRLENMGCLIKEFIENPSKSKRLLNENLQEL